MYIYCCECKEEVDAELVYGGYVYPHRPDLKQLPFWMCRVCFNFVGCHHKTKNKTNPLGCIPSNEIKNARKHIHSILDPIWQRGQLSRKSLYKMISGQIGWSYHTAKIRTIEEAREVYKIVLELHKHRLNKG